MTQSMGEAAHVVQLALTPIFLLNAVGALLSVFVTRLGRVTDRILDISKGEKHKLNELKRLSLRSRILDMAVTMVSIAGAMTCFSGITLFFGTLRDAGYDDYLFFFFGGGLLCSVTGLACFVVEVNLAGRTIRGDDNI